jgi:hypothetical protein
MALLRPTKVVSAREKANLRRGGSPGRRKRSKAEKAGAELLKNIFRSGEYLQNFQQRALEGKLQAGVEAYALQLTYGKPKDILDVNQGPTVVRIIHRLRGSDQQANDDER